ncbi:hypothetical protein J2Y37_000986 [Prolinoborus sp. 3657]|nr:hypothetical protein [Prolinoborus sp. 3657]
MGRKTEDLKYQFDKKSPLFYKKEWAFYYENIEKASYNFEIFYQLAFGRL